MHHRVVMYNELAYRINGLHEFSGTYAFFHWNFPWPLSINLDRFRCFSPQFPFKDMDGRGLFSINLIGFEKSQRKMFNGVKSQDPGNQFWKPKYGIIRSGNDTCSNLIVSRVVCHMETSSSNYLSFTSISFNLGAKFKFCVNFVTPSTIKISWKYR